MEERDFMLLYQLLRAIEEQANNLKKALNTTDAENFRVSKEELLNLQKKIGVLVR